MTKTLAKFNAKQVERKGPASFKAFSDKGGVNFPKFFRRQAELHVRVAGGLVASKDLRAFIKSKTDDVALETADFLKLKGPVVGKKPRPEFQNLAAFVKAGKYPTGPEIVFWENDSKLLKTGTNAEIKNW